MWMTKVFKTKEKMLAFLEKNQNIQHQEIFVNNAYGIEYRKLNKVY